MNRSSTSELELSACTPRPVSWQDFNPDAKLPYGCTAEHIYLTMQDFIEFLGFVNQQLHTKGIPRLESMLMPANFSSIVGEFMSSNIPKHCHNLVKNQYHNGHPDLLPKGAFPDDSAQHTQQGIEIKASRYQRGWQGHNPEETWLMVFVFDSNRPVDPTSHIPPKSFGFVKAVAARLAKDDWSFSGRSATSRRTITASVNPSGYDKMVSNWIYQVPRLN